jgi:hypothetical protein
MPAGGVDGHEDGHHPSPIADPSGRLADLVDDACGFHAGDVGRFQRAVSQHLVEVTDAQQRVPGFTVAA